MSKNDPKNTVFHKYDVEASIDEVENTETHSVFKYGFTILSNPKNVRLAIEGVTKISGDSKELDDILSKDENDVPKILSAIYQELFPTFFLLSKSLNVSCPPIQIGGMGAGNIESETNPETNNVIENTPVNISDENASPEMTVDAELENPDITQPNV
ncbi:MAG: hypothetical protein KGZ34_07225 [Nitrosarchaeum sp.]|nr:hypothetical protein [Nitrosarchaeum sp.]